MARNNSNQNKDGEEAILLEERRNSFNQELIEIGNTKKRIFDEIENGKKEIKEIDEKKILFLTDLDKLKEKRDEGTEVLKKIIELINDKRKELDKIQEDISYITKDKEEILSGKLLDIASVDETLKSKQEQVKINENILGEIHQKNIFAREKNDNLIKEESLLNDSISSLNITIEKLKGEMNEKRELLEEIREKSKEFDKTIELIEINKDKISQLNSVIEEKKKEISSLEDKIKIISNECDEKIRAAKSIEEHVDKKTEYLNALLEKARADKFIASKIK